MSDVNEIQSNAEKRRKQLLDARTQLDSELPLRFLRQQAHFTTPASNAAMAAKAVERGYSSAAKILGKFEIDNAALAEALELPEASIVQTLEATPYSPMVMIDGEDAQALRDDVVERGRANAVELFRTADWHSTLRFYRPSGLGLEYSVGDLTTVLTQVAEGREPGDYPIDGIVWPKVEQPEELAWVHDTLSQLEQHLGLERNQIRLQFLIESGWGLMRLSEIIRVCPERLSGIIFGIADYAADIELPAIINDHPVCDVARAAIINAAGALGVPAIDNMTVNYPVADKSLSPAQNRQHILSRLRECYDDARHGFELGMDGKWVGHPLQLFVVMLAHREVFSSSNAHEELSKIEAYTTAVDNEIGATIIEGVMSDRATDRHARRQLRKAIALGHFDAARGVELGVVSPEEAATL